MNNKYPEKAVSSEARKLALDVVYNVVEKGAYTNLILEKSLRKSQLQQEDKNLVTEIANGTIRMLKHLDWVLNIFLRSPVDKQNPWLRNILRISTYQLLFMDKIPDYACVNDAVNLSREKVNTKLSQVCNGVLRNIIRNKNNIEYPLSEDKISYLSVYYSQREELVKRLLTLFGEEESEKILRYYNKRAELFLRNNNIKGNINTLIGELQGEGIITRISELLPCALNVEKMAKSLITSKAFKEGRFYIQNPASMLVGFILAPREDEKIYDLCCGVGGKTTHIAEIMNNQGEIFAYDLYQHKVDLLKENSKRLGISIIKAYQEDILNISSQYGYADRVLVDVPCSGMGVLNRRADLRWTLNSDIFASLPLLQLNLLQKASELLIKGGSLVYSTCTVNKEENEDVVKSFLGKNKNYILEGFYESIDFMPLCHEDRKKAEEGMLTILPGRYNTDGMFYAKLKRLD